MVLELNIFQNKLKNPRKQNLVTNIYITPACDSIIGQLFFIEFTDFMLKGKILLDYTNLFSSKDYEWQNDTKIYSKTIKMKKIYCVTCGKYRKFGKPNL